MEEQAVKDKTFHCDVCNIDLDITSRVKHCKSFKHILKQNSSGQREPPVQEVEIPVNQVIKPTTDDFSLDDLRNDKYKPVEEPVVEVKEIQIKGKKVKSKPLFDKNDDDASVLSDNKDLFDGKPTKLFGKENLELLNRIKQYKAMFKNELSKFRIKKNATTEELREYLEEIECIINTGNVDTFVIDTILTAIAGLEKLTTRTQYDINGLAVMLKANPQFISLCKQLYLKHGNFGAVPPEYQMLLLVFTSTYLVMQKNRNKSKMENFLNQPVQQDMRET
jgi:hypothetical protein